MAEEKKKRQKRSVYLIVEKPQEFKTKKEAEKYLASQGGNIKEGSVTVYQAKKVDYNIVKMIHIG